MEFSDNVIGMKLGSRWSVGYGNGIVEKDVENGLYGPRTELTCLRPMPKDIVKGGTSWEYSRKASNYSNVIYPIEYGLPKEGDGATLKSSLTNIARYVRWWLENVDEDTGMVFALPMMKYEKGLNAFKKVLNGLPKGKLGKAYIVEAFAAAIGVCGIQPILQDISLIFNFGSSTTELALYENGKLVQQNVFDKGGTSLDMELAEAIKQEYRGVTCTNRQAQAVKEQYNYIDNNSIAGRFTKKGAIHEETIIGDTIKPIIDRFANEIATEVVQNFLPQANKVNPTVVSALQAEGVGHLVICGGLSDLPGFSQVMFEALTSSGGISTEIRLRHPDGNPGGVSAPAFGAYQLANLLESDRQERNADEWKEF
jgi:hypothetical protein